MRLLNAIAAFGCGYVIAITIIITIYSVQSYKRLRDKKLLAKSLMLLQVDARHLLFRTQPIPSERRRTKVKPNKWLLIANLIAEILLAIKVLTMR